MVRVCGALAFRRVRQGQTIKSLRGEGRPLMADTLGIVAAALACDMEFSGPQCLLDTVEEGGVIKHVWTFDGESAATFRVPQGTESVEFNEFVRRFKDEAWCMANADHPIAYLRAMWDQLTWLRSQLRERKPALKLQKVIEDGEETRTVTAIIPQDCPPEERAEYLRHFEEAS